MISVVIVDDQVMIRMAVKQILESASDIQVVGDADRAASAIELVERLLPDVVVLDLRMPGMDGVEAIRTMVARPSLVGTRILVLTTFEGDDDVLAALRAGAHGFLGKAAEPTDLIEGVRAVAQGKAMLSPAATQSVVDHLGGQGKSPDGVSHSTPPQVSSLTPREREVVQLVAAGLDNDAIARHLSISPFTVKTHINRAMQKLGATSRAQLVRIAYENDLTR